jgi:hydrogenase maturation protease
MKTVVIGIGNSILSDDSVGIKAVQAIRAAFYADESKDELKDESKKMRRKEAVEFAKVHSGAVIESASQQCFIAQRSKQSRANVKFIETSTGGINLMEHMAGFQRAVIIDAIVTGKHKAGTVFKFIYPDMPYTRNTVSTHDMDMPMALEMGKYLGITLPSEIVIFAVEAKDTVNFGENLTGEVKTAMRSVVSEIKCLLANYN